MTTDRSEQSGPDGAPPSLHEAIAVFDHSASRTHPNGQTRAWAVIREHLSSHQQAVEALRADLHDWSGRALREQTAHHEAVKRAESAEARLARVAGLVVNWRRESDWTGVTGAFADELAAAIAPQEVR